MLSSKSHRAARRHSADTEFSFSEADIFNHCTREDYIMGTELKVGIQGRGSATVSDLSILAGLLENQTGIRMTPVLQDSILLKMEWLKNGTIDCM